MKVQYDGLSDLMILAAADFKKAGVKEGKTEFPRGVAVEVSDAAAEALLSDEGIFADFSFSEADEDEEEEPNPPAPKKKTRSTRKS